MTDEFIKDFTNLFKDKAGLVLLDKLVLAWFNNNSVVHNSSDFSSDELKYVWYWESVGVLTKDGYGNYCFNTKHFLTLSLINLYTAIKEKDNKTLKQKYSKKHTKKTPTKNTPNTFIITQTDNLNNIKLNKQYNTYLKRYNT